MFFPKQAFILLLVTVLASQASGSKLEDELKALQRSQQQINALLNTTIMQYERELLNIQMKQEQMDKTLNLHEQKMNILFDIHYSKLTICKGRIQLKYRYCDKTFNVTNEIQCLQECSKNDESEVFQFSTDGQCICGRGNLKARYFEFVPRRYLTCGSSIETIIIYRKDRLKASLTAIGQPYLFYALDGISGLVNSANKEDSYTDASWKGWNKSRFDCAPITTRGAKTLKLFKSDVHQVRARFSGFDNKQGFTMMAWAKRRTRVSRGFESILSTDEPNQSYFGQRSDHPNKFYFNYPDTYGPTVNHSVSINSWNHVAMRVSVNNSEWFAVNGEIAWSGRGSSKPQRYREIFIGSLYENGHSWDGCLAHVAVFKRALSIDEVKSVSALFTDEDF